MFSRNAFRISKLGILAVMGSTLFLMLPATTAHSFAADTPIDFAVNEQPETESAPGFPYTKPFIISAYYSPLPDQQRYVTGSLAGDIRLNGNGTNGADGTPVYPGMIAAPRTYPFGTKMNIPGVGLVAVHDRGGAIVSSGVRGHAHDRLDIWMGYGDEGLNRALQWGKRTVDVTVYGINDSLMEDVTLAPVHVPNAGPADGFNADLPAVDDPASFEQPGTAAESAVPSEPAVEPKPVASIGGRQLAMGSNGSDVAKVQQLLRDLDYYSGEAHASFDDLTRAAVAKFQVDHGIVSTERSFGAGYVGPKTYAVLANVAPKAAAQSLEENYNTVQVFSSDLELGSTGGDVRELQEELRRINLLGIEPTGYYGPVTRHAVFKFQQTQKLVQDKESTGAGTFGPVTRGKLNQIVATRLRTERVAIEKQS